MVAPHSLFASCAPGLEPLLAAELDALGALEPRVEPGGVACAGHRAVVARINLGSGLASHLLVRVGRFVATRFEGLERELGALPLERFLQPGVPRALRVTAKKSRLHHTGAIAERAGRAIAKRLGDGLVDPDADGVPVQIRLVRDRVEVSLDTSGAPLHRRGYRLDPGAAPLREDLAHALVLASGWDRASPLVDPMVGVGTIAIEAARLARGIAPGRDRGFALERTALFHEATLRDVREALDARVVDGPPVLGSDRDAAAIDAARANAERAGVSPALTVSPLSEAPIPDAPVGALVTDPPHGRRLRGDARPLLAALGRRIAALPPGWCVALYAADRRRGHAVAPGLETAFVTDAGGMKLRALRRLGRGRASGGGEEPSEALLRADDQPDALDAGPLDEG